MIFNEPDGYKQDWQTFERYMTHVHPRVMHYSYHIQQGHPSMSIGAAQLALELGSKDVAFATRWEFNTPNGIIPVILLDSLQWKVNV